MLREWLEAHGVSAPVDAPGGRSALAGSGLQVPDMRGALTLPEVRRREAALRAADPGHLAAAAACSSVFWLCGHAVENPEEVAEYALVAKEHRCANHAAQP